MTTDDGRGDGHTEFTSEGSLLVEFSDSGAEIDQYMTRPMPMTPEYVLTLMRMRVRFYGSPLPDGYVPPPGIDIEALLKQVPWPPPQ
jgi:hypothetical protein